MVRCVSWLMLVGLAVAASGCATGGLGAHNNLTLQGIKSVELGEVVVNSLSSADPDKLGGTIRQQLDANLEADNRWGNSKPRAIADVEVTEAKLDYPLRLKYIVRARDSQTGTSLGEASGQVRIGADLGTAAILGGTIAVQQQMAQAGLPANALQQMAIGQLVTSVQEQLASARRHPPIDRREKQPIRPENPPAGHDSKMAAR